MAREEGIAVNIAIAFSPNWSEYVEVEIFAIFKTNKPPVTIYLASDELTTELEKFRNIEQYFGEGYSIEHINVDPLYRELVPSSLNVDTRFTKYTLYRLVLPKLIDVDRLLYIDADALVDGDLSELYNVDMKDNLVAGCIDTGIYEPRYRYMLRNIGLTLDDNYINAGVALFNWKEIRESNLCETWIYEVNNFHYGCHDQDIINKHAKGKILIVDNKYNSSLSTGFSKNPIICHYAGSKPWSDTKVVNYHIWDKWERAYREATR